MNEITKKIAELYERSLNTELGEGNLKRKLLSQLELILTHVRIPNDAMYGREDILDKPIDYNTIMELSDILGYSKGAVTRVNTFFKKQGITTYGDIVSAYQEKLKSGFVGNPEEFLKYQKDMGNKSVEVLMTHLEMVGVKFPSTY